MRIKWLSFEFISIFVSVCCFLAFWFYPQSNESILLLDRQRNLDDPSDFVSRFVKVCELKHDFKNGYLELVSSPGLEEQLLLLIAGIQKSYNVELENRHLATNYERYRKWNCRINKDGSCIITQDPSYRSSMGLANDHQKNLESLAIQYETISSIMADDRLAGFPATMQNERPDVSFFSQASKNTADLEEVSIAMNQPIDSINTQGVSVSTNSSQSISKDNKKSRTILSGVKIIRICTDNRYANLPTLLSEMP